MNHSELEASISTRGKLRIYAQLVGYERLPQPLMRQAKNPVTGEVTTIVEEYKEFDGKQFAVNYNSLYISESNFDKLLLELMKAIKDDAIKKGLIQS